MTRRLYWIPPLALSLMAMGTTDSCSDDPSPGTQGTIELVRGNNQTGPAGQALAQALAVRIVGTSGKRIVGRPIHWIVATGGGSVSADYSETQVVGVGGGTAADAYAEVVWTLGSGSGPQTLFATVDDLDPADTLVFTATATGGVTHPLAEIQAYNGTSTAGVTMSMLTPFQGTRSFGPIPPNQLVSDSLQVEVGVAFRITATVGQLAATIVCTTTAGIIPDAGNPNSGDALVAVFNAETGGLTMSCNGNWVQPGI